jgi:hypothetical protein
MIDPKGFSIGLCLIDSQGEPTTIKDLNTSWTISYGEWNVLNENIRKEIIGGLKLQIKQSINEDLTDKDFDDLLFNEDSF